MVLSKEARKVINSTKNKVIRGVSNSNTPLGEIGYDNVRDDIERVKKMREGLVEKVPTFEKDIVNKEYVDSIASKQVVELFFTANASDIATYDDLDIDISPDAEDTITQTITAGSTTLINAFASKLGEEEINNLEILESGIYDFHIHAKANFASGMTLYFEFYHRTAGGTETLLGTSHDTPILTTTDANYEVHASTTDETIFISGDRIVVKVYGRNTGAANKDITIAVEGDTLSRVEFPGFISPTFVPDHAHPPLTKHVTIEDPTDAEDFTVCHFPAAVTITEVVAVVIGSSTPSVTIEPQHNTDRSAAGNNVLSAATAITSETTGQTLTSFDDATLPADSYLWIETTAQSGTVDELHITITYTED